MEKFLLTLLVILIVGKTTLSSPIIKFSEEGDDLFSFDPKVNITLLLVDSYSTLGRVNGYRACGGPAKVVDWFFDGCSGKRGEVCSLLADGINKRVELSFVPSEDIKELGVLLNVITIHEGTGLPVDRFYVIDVPNSEVKKGVEYNVLLRGSPTEELKGEMMKIQYVLYRPREHNFVEACVEAEFKNV